MARAYSTDVAKASSTVATPSSPSAVANLVADKLEEIAREGARRMLAEAVELEVNEFLQRLCYEHSKPFRG